MTTVYCEKIVGQQYHQYRQKRTKQRIASTRPNFLYTGSGWGQAQEVSGVKRVNRITTLPLLVRIISLRAATLDAISKRISIFYKESFAIEIKSMNINYNTLYVQCMCT